MFVVTRTACTDAPCPRYIFQPVDMDYNHRFTTPSCTAESDSQDGSYRPPSVPPRASPVVGSNSTPGGFYLVTSPLLGLSEDVMILVLDDTERTRYLLPR